MMRGYGERETVGGKTLGKPVISMAFRFTGMAMCIRSAVLK